MASITDNTRRAVDALNGIENAIINNGVDMSGVSSVEEYPAKIDEVYSVGYNNGGGMGIIVDQTYKPTSANAQSGKAVAEAIESVEFKIGDMDNLHYPATEPEHRNLVKAFNWLQEYHNGDIQTLYEIKVDRVVLNEINANLDTKITVNSQAITELQQDMGDVDTALENIIAMQNSYIGGGSV